jgi:hypothetical protein
MQFIIVQVRISSVQIFISPKGVNKKLRKIYVLLNSYLQHI